MLGRTDWQHLIPHAGSMCLLDAVVAWDATTIHAISTGHARADHPLRGAGGLHAVHLIEYGAQAMAVHGALLARAGGAENMRPGMLVSVREVSLDTARIDDLDGRLDVHAACLHADASGAHYAFRIEHRGRLLASGRTMAIHTGG
jgi:predicted hotdog family 3-hydroxylacyl-ACP dehydratase